MVLQDCSICSPVGRFSNGRSSQRGYEAVDASIPPFDQVESFSLAYEIESLKSCACSASDGDLHTSESIQSAIDGFYYCWYCLPEHQLLQQIDD